MSDTPFRYLDAEALARLGGLSLAARRVVDGYVAGQHRSPRKGYSVEFAEHREYTPGVDPRHLDWRVLGRRDKLYVKQYEEETSLRAHLVLDTSASMAYRSDSAKLAKSEYAAFLAATLAYLMAGQHDAVGLCAVSDKVAERVPARQGLGHVRDLLGVLERTTPAGETALAKALHELAETLPRRALVVVLSDLFDDPNELVGALRHFRHNRSEVIVIQTLDPAEVSFPFEDVTRVEDCETGRAVVSDPLAFRKAYLEALAAHNDTLRRGCAAAQIDLVSATTDEPFDRFLGKYLARRQGMGG